MLWFLGLVLLHLGKSPHFRIYVLKIAENVFHLVCEDKKGRISFTDYLQNALFVFPFTSL